MARKKPTPFSTTGFGRVHEKAGTPADVQDYLQKEGLAPTETTPTGRRSRRTRSRGVRRKGKKAFKSRSFRLSHEADEKLEWLAKHYDTYLVGVIELVLHNEWDRVRRKLRRRASKKS